jgi:hypothetical protein
MNRFVSLAGERIGDLIGHVAESGRLARGRALFRKGAVLDLSVTSGTLLAEVRGSTGGSYETTVAASLATPGVIREVADGYDPRDRRSIDHLLHDGVQITPRVTDLAFSCTCADWEEPCKHAIAVLFAFADRVDLDEVELLRWRGIDYSTPSASTTDDEPDDLLDREPDDADRTSPKRNRSRSADVGELRGLLGDTAPAFGPGRRRKRRLTPPRPEPSPALTEFLGRGHRPEPVEVPEFSAAAPLFAEPLDGVLVDVGPRLAEALAIIADRVGADDDEHRHQRRSR